MNKQAIEVTVTELKEIIDRYLNAGSSINYAIKIVGHPGVGKSSVVRQVARDRNFLFIDTRLAFKENIDLGGYPVPDHASKKMVYYRPKFIPPETLPEGYKGILWFLDESNRAHPTVIQTLFQIITEHICGEHQLPDCTSILLAGNLGETDNTTITEFDDSALDGRLAIFHLKPSAKEWLKWAGGAEIHPAIIHYISLFPERLWDEKHIHPNPRGWHQVSQTITLSYGLETEGELKAYLSSNTDSPLEKTITALIGDVAGFDFIMQLTVPRLISTSDIINGSDDKLESMKKGKIPAEDILWAISGAVSWLREKAVNLKSDFKEDDLSELGNILRFIGMTRSDARMSFFYLLLRECGLLTKIPAALEFVRNKEERAELLKKFDAVMNM
ncbi:hypothetical protein [Desulforegula conservatrix]|uniref:hypothetical protein n=1 Tax=Desulforegula conservatrix TaxID=153026 RepID=UPI00040F7A14|nr:hypothetical protein [Desulforegula conservatrix]